MIPITYQLDAMPTRQQAAMLPRIEDGDRIVAAPSGKGFVWERGPGGPHHAVINSLINNQSPGRTSDGPLFGEDHQGRLTVRGQFTLIRYRGAL